MEPDRSEVEAVRRSVVLLAAAFPRSAWKADSDAAYTLALIDAGASSHEVQAAVRLAIQQFDQLPTVADLLGIVKEQRPPIFYVCPACESQRIAVIDGEPVLCFDCDWAKGSDATAVDN